MTRPLYPLLLLVGVSLAWAGPAGAQPHHPHPSPPDSDPFLRVMLEGPHLVLAHDGFLGLTREQLAVLRPLREAVCVAAVDHARGNAQLRRELSGLLEDDVEDVAVLPLLDRLGTLDRSWMLALVRARRGTMATLEPGQREQLGWLGDHWRREATVMIEAATHPAQRGHPGTQLAIRVPGMVVAETVLTPFCEALHGPAVHISIPPPR